MALKFSNAAKDDLLAIYIEGIIEFGEAQAERYHTAIKNSLSFIESNPEAVRERGEISPPVRIHRSGAHLIVYQVQNSDVFVIRIRHGREDWLSNPTGE